MNPRDRITRISNKETTDTQQKLKNQQVARIKADKFILDNNNLTSGRVRDGVVIPDPNNRSLQTSKEEIKKAVAPTQATPVRGSSLGTEKARQLEQSREKLENQVRVPAKDSVTIPTQSVPQTQTSKEQINKILTPVAGISENTWKNLNDSQRQEIIRISTKEVSSAQQKIDIMKVAKIKADKFILDNNNLTSGRIKDGVVIPD